ncbi:MAG: hypothetical protein WD557_10385 [Dehalococcoidia bacterium]
MNLPHLPHGLTHWRVDPLEIKHRQRELREDFQRPGSRLEGALIWGGLMVAAFVVGIVVWVTG